MHRAILNTLTTIKHILLFLVAVFTGHMHFAQPDKVVISFSDDIAENKPIHESRVPVLRRSPDRTFILPVSLILYGFSSTGNKNENWGSMDIALKNHVQRNNPAFHTRVDDHLQYAPVVLVYLLNATGVKGKHDLRDRTMICLLSGAFTFTFVKTIKSVMKEERPDTQAPTSFPSGHTALAFSSAYFLHQEYKQQSPWYGVAGYTMAAGTGMLRILNNRHWLKDVVAGAGFGILSGQLAYLLYPKIKQWLFGEKKQQGMAMAISY